jgi:hypothetical protein
MMTQSETHEKPKDEEVTNLPLISVIILMSSLSLSQSTRTTRTPDSCLSQRQTTALQTTPSLPTIEALCPPPTDNKQASKPPPAPPPPPQNGKTSHTTFFFFLQFSDVAQVAIIRETNSPALAIRKYEKKKKIKSSILLYFWVYAREIRIDSEPVFSFKSRFFSKFGD